MFGSKTREITHLRRLVATRTQQRDDARTMSDMFKGNTARIAQRYATAVQIRPDLKRLHRALRACAGYRRDLTAAHRLIRDQQRQLDQLLGLDDVAVLAGQNWQATREDKRREVQS